MKQGSKWTEKEIQFIYDNYEKLKAKEIAERLGRTTTAVQVKIGKLGLTKNRKSYTDETLQYIRDNYTKHDKELAEEIGLHERTIRRLRKENNIPRCPKRQKYILPHKRKWDEDTVRYIQENKEMSNEFFAKELGLDPSTIRRIRNMYGIDNPNKEKPFCKYSSTAEQDVKTMLDFLGVEYISQFPVGKYFVDFVVGNKAIEVQGDYWHGNPENEYETLNERQQRAKKTDLEKKEFLENYGFEVLWIWESEIEDGRAFSKLTTFLQGLLCLHKPS